MPCEFTRVSAIFIQTHNMHAALLGSCVIVRGVLAYITVGVFIAGKHC